MKKVLKIVDSINLKICYVAMIALFVLMCLTTIDTITRKIPKDSVFPDWMAGGIPDSMDLTELMMIFIVFCGLAYLESERGHIRVDMFVNMLPRMGKRIVEGLLLVLEAAILFLMTYSMFEKILTTLKNGAATQLLHIPQWPFVIVVVIAMFFYSLIVLVHAIEVLGGFTEEKQELPGEAIEAEEAALE